MKRTLSLFLVIIFVSFSFSLSSRVLLHVQASEDGEPTEQEEEAAAAALEGLEQVDTSSSITLSYDGKVDCICDQPQDNKKCDQILVKCGAIKGVKSEDDILCRKLGYCDCTVNLIDGPYCKAKGKKTPGL